MILVAIIIKLFFCLKQHATREVYIDEWREVFMIAAEIYLFGAIIYAMLADGKKQWWAEGVKWNKGKSVHLHEPTENEHLTKNHENGFTSSIQS